jgi:hypothetical protein
MTKLQAASWLIIAFSIGNYLTVGASTNVVLTTVVSVGGDALRFRASPSPPQWPGLRF